MTPASRAESVGVSESVEPTGSSQGRSETARIGLSQLESGRVRRCQAMSGRVRAGLSESRSVSTKDRSVGNR